MFASSMEVATRDFDVEASYVIVLDGENDKALWSLEVYAAKLR